MFSCVNIERYQDVYIILKLQGSLNCRDACISCQLMGLNILLVVVMIGCGWTLIVLRDMQRRLRRLHASLLPCSQT